MRSPHPDTAGELGDISINCSLERCDTWPTSQVTLATAASDERDGTPLHLFLGICRDIRRRSSAFQLVVTVIWATVAFYIQAAGDLDAPWLDTLGLGSWQRIAGWVISVPIYVFLGIYACRYLGSFLVRSWALEVLNSDSVRQAAMRFGASMVSDDACRTALAGHIGHLFSAVLSTRVVHEALVDSIAAALRDPSMQRAASESAVGMMETMKSEEMAKPLAKLAAEVFKDVALKKACADVSESVLANTQVHESLKASGRALLRDKEVFEAGYEGVADALNGSGMACCAPGDMLCKS